MAENRAFTLLPEYLKTIYNRRTMRILEDLAFEPEDFSRVEGQIGSKTGVTDTEISRDPFIPERNLEREAYQLSVAVTSKTKENTDKISFYTDLVGQLRGEDADISDHSKLFDSDWFSWSPPIDIDMWTNFHRYVWTGAGDARYQGEYITREAQGSQTYLYEIVNGAGVPRIVEMSSVSKTSFSSGSADGDLKEDCTDSKRRIYRWNTSTWEPVFFSATDGIPTDWTPWQNGEYVYPCSTGNELQRCVVYEYRTEPGRWIPRTPIVSFEPPTSPYDGTLWEDARDEPKRTIRKWDGTQWSEITWTTTTDMNGTGVGTQGQYKFYAVNTSSVTDDWAKNNWWRNRDDLSDKDKATYSTQQAVRPILCHHAGMELFTGSSRDARHDLPRYKLWAYDEAADDVLEITDDNFPGQQLTNGSTVVQYKVNSTGSDDSFLGFPLILNATAEITFDATIESEVISTTAGTILGYRFYNDVHTGTLRSLWSKASTPIKPELVDGFYELPKALTNNPDHETLTDFTRSEVLRHFESMIEAQSEGEPLGANGYRWTCQCVTTGATLIDPEHSMIRTMALILDENLDLPEAIRAMAIEYERFNDRLVYAINRVWSEDSQLELDALTYKTDKTATTFADAALTYVLDGYNETRPFWYSDMGTYVHSVTEETLPISVPPSAARTGAVPTYSPRKFTDSDGDWLINHDGSLQAAWGDERDNAWLDVQTRFFNKIPTIRRQETATKSTRLDDVGFWIDRYANKWVPEITFDDVNNLVEDHTAIGSPTSGQRVYSENFSSVATYTGTEWQLFRVSYSDVFKATDTGYYWSYNGFELVRIYTYERDGTFDYTYNEGQSLFRREYETWAGANGFDPYAAIHIVDNDDPFTWNMTAAGVAGGWRSIYKRVYGTDRPHIAPWECWGFTIEPSWWRTTYVPSSTAADGSPRYNASHAMWADLKIGNLPSVTIEDFMLLNSNAPIPVNSSGELLDPVAAGIIDDAGSVPEDHRNDRWDYGGLGPVELEFTRSVRYTFTKALASYLMKPNRFVEKLWTNYVAPIGKNKIWRGPIQVDIKTWKRSKIADVSVHGEDPDLIDSVVDTDTSVGNPGINSWISEFINLRGGNPSDEFGYLVRGSSPVLSWKCSGFINRNRTSLTLPNGIEVPFEDIHTILHRSRSTDSYFHSGAAIVRSGTGYRLYGYDSGNPEFKFEHSSRSLESGITERTEEFTATDAQSEFVITQYSVGDADKGRFTVLVNGIRISSSDITFADSHTFIIPPDRVKTGNIVTAILRSATTDYRSHLTHFVAGGQRWSYNPVGNGTIGTVPYGHWFETPEEVLQFFVDHGRYMATQGWSWEDPDDPTAGVDDWISVAKRFTDWAAEGPEEGAIFIDCPSSTSLTLTLLHGDVGSIETIKRGVYGVLDAGGSAIRPEDVEVTKDGSRVTVRPMDDETDIFGLRILSSEIEHILYVSNTTRFNDIIYSPVTGLKHSRMRLKSYRTSNWNGRMEAPGFIINDKDLIPNFTKLAKDFARYYDSIDPIDDPLKFDQAWWLYAYRQRDYLETLGASPQTQIDYHRGLIADKGTTKPIKAYASGTVGGTIDVDEIWAWHSGFYGETSDRMRFRFNLYEHEIRDRVIVAKFIDEDAPDDADVEVLPPSSDLLRWVDPVPDSKNPVIPMVDNTPVSDLIYKMKLVNRDGIYQKLIHWDPEVGLHEPYAYSQVDIETDIDPAVYTDGPSSIEIELDTWGPKQVGTIWWDTSKRNYASYRTEATPRDAAGEWGLLDRVYIVRTDIQDTDYRLTTKTAHNLSVDDSIQVGLRDGNKFIGFVVNVVDSSTIDVSIFDPSEPESTIIDVVDVDVSYITTNKIEIYEWIESDVAPDQYVIDNGSFSVINPGDPDYVTYRPRTSTETKYYFWAAFNQTPALNKELSVFEIRERLEDPTANNIAWFAPVSSSAMIIRPYTFEKEDVYEVDVEIEPDASRIHNEWVLFIEGDNKIDSEITTKLIDSLLEEDTLGNAIPRTAFLGSDLYGTGPGKTVFNNVVFARRRFLGALNQQLLAYRALDDSSWSNYFPADEEGTWWSVANWEDPNWSGIIASEELANTTEFNDIERPSNDDLVKVKAVHAHPTTTSTTGSATYSREAGTWTEIRAEYSTIEIDDTIFDGANARKNLESLFTFVPSTKISSVVVSLFGEIIRQHTNCWWMFKTSLVDLKNNIAIGQPATRPADEIPLITNAFIESKPYHTKIRSTRTTATVDEPDTTLANINDEWDIRVTTRLDRLGNSSIDENGWDSEPWDTSGWDLQQWVPSDAELWWIDCAEFTSVKGQRVYTIEKVPSYVDIKIVKLDGSIAPVYSLVKYGDKIDVQFSSSPPIGTYKLQGALMKFEGREASHLTTSFSTTQMDLQHAAPRAGYPRIIGTGSNESLQERQFFGGDSVLNDPLGGDMDERIVTPTSTHLNINVKEYWTSARAGWDTVPWDMTPWDIAPPQNGFAEYFIRGEDVPAKPQTVIDSVFASEAFITDSGTATAQALRATNDNVRISKIEVDWGNTGTFVVYNGTVTYPTESSVSFTRTDVLTSKYQGVELVINSTERIKDITLSGSTLTAGSDYTLTNDDTTATIAAGQDVGTVVVTHELPTDVGNVVRLSYDRYYSSNKNLALIGGRVTPEWTKHYIGITDHFPQVALKLTDSDRIEFPYREGLNSDVFSIEMTIILDNVGTTSSSRILVNKGNGTGDRHFRIALKGSSTSTPRLSWTNNTPAISNLDWKSAIPTNTPITLTVTSDGNTLKLYYNGKLETISDISSTGISPSSFDRPVEIKSSASAIARIADFRIWKKEITETEVSNNIRTRLSGGHEDLILDAYFDGSLNDESYADNGTLEAGSETYEASEGTTYDLTYSYPWGTEKQWSSIVDSNRGIQLHSVVDDIADLNNARTIWSPVDGTMVLSLSDNIVYKMVSDTWTSEYTTPWENIDYIDNSTGTNWKWVKSAGVTTHSDWVISSVIYTKPDEALTDIEFNLDDERWTFADGTGTVVTDPNSSFGAGQSKVMQITSNGTPITATCVDRIKVRRDANINALVLLHVEGTSALSTAVEISLNFYSEDGTKLSTPASTKEITKTGNLYWPVRLSYTPPIEAVEASITVTGSDEETIRFVAKSLSHGIEPYNSSIPTITSFEASSLVSILGLDNSYTNENLLLGSVVPDPVSFWMRAAFVMEDDRAINMVNINENISYTGIARTIGTNWWDYKFTMDAPTTYSVTGTTDPENVWDSGGYVSMILYPETGGTLSNGAIISKKDSDGWEISHNSDDILFNIDFSSNDGSWSADISGVTLTENVPFILEVSYDSSSDSNVPVMMLNGEVLTVTEVSAPSGTRVEDSSSTLEIGGNASTTANAEVSEVIIGNGERSNRNEYFYNLATRIKKAINGFTFE